MANCTVWTVQLLDGRVRGVHSSRERILNAAESRLLAGGPGALVIESVAADAGISKGGLLYHFPSKEALVAGLCERMLESFDRDLTELSDSDQESAGAWTRAYLATTVTGEEPFSEITGGVVSCTVTVRVACAALLPEASCTS